MLYFCTGKVRPIFVGR